MKFKVGDLVKLVNIDYLGEGMTLGKIYKVKGIDYRGNRGFILINWSSEKEAGYFYEYRFELAQDTLKIHKRLLK